MKPLCVFVGIYIKNIQTVESCPSLHILLNDLEKTVFVFKRVDRYPYIYIVETTYIVEAKRTLRECLQNTVKQRVIHFTLMS